MKRTTAAALLKDMARGSLWNLEALLTRVIGKPKEVAKIDSDSKIEVVFLEGKTTL